VVATEEVVALELGAIDEATDEATDEGATDDLLDDDGATELGALEDDGATELGALEDDGATELGVLELVCVLQPIRSLPTATSSNQPSTPLLCW